jgi:glycosyltransferase involved in cell wall biosynthesis
MRAGNISLNRYKDRALSRDAKRIALDDEAALFCYSYYASEAFKQGSIALRYRFLFQLHPHPMSVRRILLEEIERVPRAKSSLMIEHELSLSEAEFEELAAEPHLANGWVVASSYSAQTLSAHGIPADQIHVVPYGVDGRTFAKRLRPPNSDKPFTIVFVGSLIQRKGLSYLLEAVRRLKSRNTRVLLFGRGPVDRQIIGNYSDINIEVNVGLAREELVLRMYEGDVFVLPSLAEGFAHVIMEAMSCGLPVITTSHTCAPDIMTEGEHGFIVPIRDQEAIAEKLAWGLDNRADLAAMGETASAQVRLFTWDRFRQGIRETYKRMVASARQ